MNRNSPRSPLGSQKQREFGLQREIYSKKEGVCGGMQTGAGDDNAGRLLLQALRESLPGVFNLYMSQVTSKMMKMEISEKYIKLNVPVNMLVQRLIKPSQLPRNMKLKR